MQDEEKIVNDIDWKMTVEEIEENGCLINGD